LQRHAKTLEDINARLQDTQAQLVEAERFAAIGEVTAAVTHGITNPLGNIRVGAHSRPTCHLGSVPVYGRLRPSSRSLRLSNAAVGKARHLCCC
jgi:hypothetical protein